MLRLSQPALALLVALPGALALPRATAAGTDHRARLGATEASWIAQLHKQASRGANGVDTWTCWFNTVTTRLEVRFAQGRAISITRQLTGKDPHVDSFRLEAQHYLPSDVRGLPPVVAANQTYRYVSRSLARLVAARWFLDSTGQAGPPGSFTFRWSSNATDSRHLRVGACP